MVTDQDHKKAHFKALNLFATNSHNMKHVIIIACSWLILLTGCREKETTVNDYPAVPEESIDHAQDRQAVWKEDIQLNQGTQWKANRETTEGILNMTRVLAQSSPSSAEEYRELGKALAKEKNLVLKRCTMKGPSHNNLHIYLQPLIGKIGELQEVDSVEKGKQLLTEIEEHLKAYHTYFI